jgi:peroxiredoxin
MGASQRSTNFRHAWQIKILADGNLDFGKLVDLTVDAGAYGGLRLRRFAAIVSLWGLRPPCMLYA